MASGDQKALAAHGPGHLRIVEGIPQEHRLVAGNARLPQKVHAPLHLAHRVNIRQAHDPVKAAVQLRVLSQLLQEQRFLGGRENHHAQPRVVQATDGFSGMG